MALGRKDIRIKNLNVWQRLNFFLKYLLFLYFYMTLYLRIGVFILLEAMFALHTTVPLGPDY